MGGDEATCRAALFPLANTAFVSKEQHFTRVIPRLVTILNCETKDPKLHKDALLALFNILRIHIDTERDRVMWRHQPLQRALATNDVLGTLLRCVVRWLERYDPKDATAGFLVGRSVEAISRVLLLASSCPVFKEPAVAVGVEAHIRNSRE